MDTTESHIADRATLLAPYARDLLNAGVKRIAIDLVVEEARRVEGRCDIVSNTDKPKIARELLKRIPELKGRMAIAKCGDERRSRKFAEGYAAGLAAAAAALKALAVPAPAAPVVPPLTSLKDGDVVRAKGAGFQYKLREVRNDRKGAYAKYITISDGYDSGKAVGFFPYKEYELVS